MGLSTGHLLIILLIVALVFGTKKLGSIGKDLGSAVKGFKDGMKGEEEKKDPAKQITTIDVEAKEKKGD